MKMFRNHKTRQRLLLLSILLCPLTAHQQLSQPILPLSLRQKLRPQQLQPRQPQNRQQRRHPQLIQ